VMTDNYEVAKALWEAVESNRSRSWWKRVTKYYHKVSDKEPYYETTDSSSSK
jgi:hypothetical protein